MNTISLKCEHCGKNFNRALKEYKRNKKQGRKIFCSRHCVGHYMTPNIIDKAGKWHEGLARKEDELTHFRKFMRSIRNRSLKYDVSIEYLKELWERQNGICPYTGFKMILKRKRGLYQASLDRIDPSKGYMKGNVEFVCLAINYAKNCSSKEELLDFIKKIRNKK